jgi:hypothetical protein
LLAAILGTQRSFRGRFEELELALPLSTQFALGPSLPSGLGVFVMVSVIVRRYATGRRFRERWNILAIVVLGFVAGHYATAMFLPYITLDGFVP